jgi:20S proteasome subunit alpha 5
MFLRKSEYDRGVNTFSPEGRLFQVEYAIEAIKLGSIAIGVQVADGVVLGVEKRVTSPLLEASSIEKIKEIDSHCGCAMSGLTADARTMVDHVRVDAQHHRFTYDEPLGVESTIQSICDLALRFGEGRSGGGRKEDIMSRPFGVALLVGGVDDDGPSLFHANPSGTYIRYLAKAIGAGSEGAQNTLEEEYNRSMSLDEATHLVVKILKQVMEEKIKSTNIEIAVVPTDTRLYATLPLERVAAIIEDVAVANPDEFAATAEFSSAADQ